MDFSNFDWSLMQYLHQPVSWATAFAMVALLGATKKYTVWAETKVFGFIKPVQPLVVYLLAFATPHVGNWLHLARIPDAQVMASAPVATLFAVACAEIMAKLTSKPKGF